MKKLFTPLLLLAGLATITNKSDAQPLQLQWAKTITSTGAVFANQCAADPQGNLYTTGNFTLVADLDPGTGVANFDETQGNTFLAKYDAQGNYLWAFQLDANATNICVDNNGDVYISGNFDSTADFDPGTGTSLLTSANTFDAFVAKYDANGNYLNAFSIGGGSSETVAALEADNSGNIIITGDFSDTIDIDPGAGTQLLMSNSGNDDAFIAKYSASGNLVYGFKLSTSGTDRGFCLAVDQQDNIYAGGTFMSSMDFDPGAGTAIFTLPGINGYLAKYDAAGNYLAGYAWDGTLYHVALDASGNIFLAGRMSDSMDADPGAGVAMIYFTGFNDTWLAKLDATGNHLYSKALFGNSQYQSNGLNVNGLGSAYLYGFMTDTVDLNPGGSGGVFVAQGAQDAYFAKYDGNLALDNATSLASAGTDRIMDMYCAPGIAWLTGHYTGTIDIDLSSGTNNLTYTNTAAFIARYTDVGTAVPTLSTNNEAKIYSVGDRVIVDFSSFSKVNAEVKVTDMLGRTIAERTHSNNGMLNIDLTAIASQVCIVTININGNTQAVKVWIE
ncbi:MAG TPA: hypothetical protein VEB40_02475 [Flavipsychrobacter sp.]|nr:hypothetical protein [Flavipsychrobacter sp.]